MKLLVLAIAALAVAGPTAIGKLALVAGLPSIAARLIEDPAAKGVALEDHAAHLMVHGTLHLLGYDHIDDDRAADMEAREVRALAALGISNPYEVTA